VPPLEKQKYPELENYAASTAGARNQAMIPHIRAIIDGAKANNLVAAGSSSARRKPRPSPISKAISDMGA
jgi:hypothetical protein